MNINNKGYENDLDDELENQLSKLNDENALLLMMLERLEYEDSENDGLDNEE